MLAGVASRIQQHLKRITRKGGAGPAGSRFEHWGAMGSDGPGSALVAATLARCLAGDVPVPARRAFLSARLVCNGKAGGGAGVRSIGIVQWNGIGFYKFFWQLASTPIILHP